MAAIKDPYDLFSDLGIVFEYDTAKLNGRHIRYLGGARTLQVGDDNFDRWANSVEQEFDLGTKIGQRAFRRWATGENGE